jgi:Tol biopolymer transport system component
VLTSGQDKTDLSISRDGQTLLFASDPDRISRIYSFSLKPGDDQKPKPVTNGAGTQGDPKFSPDGLWFTYESTESGRSEVFLSPFPIDRGPPRQQVSDAGGTGARWGADGRTVYYNGFGETNKIIRVRVDPRTGEVGPPETLTRVDRGLGWETSPDGRFLIMRAEKGVERRTIKVILNFPSTLSRKASR